MFIYIATTLLPQQTYRTHSPKLRLLLVNNIELKCSLVWCRKYHKSWSNGEPHISVDLLCGTTATELHNSVDLRCDTTAAELHNSVNLLCGLTTATGLHNSVYRKIPKISPGAYIFQRPFLGGLFLEGLIFGGAYLRKEICVSKSIGLAL